MSSLEQGKDIGHYGRLVFVMIGRHFLDGQELVSWLTKDPDCSEEKASVLVQQVEDRGYNPPRREKILEWMSQQDFPICPDATNPNACNVYKDFSFDKQVYDHIAGYHEQMLEAHPNN